MSKNYEFFLNADLKEFVGQWVAVVDEKIVANGTDFSRVFKEVKSKFPLKTPFVAMVPSKTAMLY